MRRTSRFINNNFHLLSRVLGTVILFSLSYIILAQPGDPNGGGPPAPITGLEYLIGGGILIAVRQFYKKNFKK
jgi:hypothetical protein